ncbi:hypothetical protein PVK06_005762 [Gossypium arboreum]|uniref:Uncharacterized protein n=1 Tax=Gossypium arboreum TaxID=29729 RepID=A0ABR0QVE5_GOSAR|nr:hypothetical protein PVK06_005762 [Gossypium arboreum]
MCALLHSTKILGSGYEEKEDGLSSFNCDTFVQRFTALSYTHISSTVYSYSSGIVSRCGTFRGLELDLAYRRTQTDMV